MKKMILALVAIFVALTVRADYLRKVESLIESENGTTTNVSFIRMPGEARNLATDVNIRPNMSETRSVRQAGLDGYPDKIPGMGSAEILRHYLATNSTEISINIYQEDENGDQIVLAFGGNFGKWSSYQAFVTQLNGWVKQTAERGMTYPQYNSALPVLVFYMSRHEEYVREVGEFYSTPTFFGSMSFTPVSVGGKLLVPDNQNVSVQIQRNVGVRFKESLGWVVYAKMEIRDSLGNLTMYKSYFDISDYDIFVGYGLGEFFIEDRHMTKGVNPNSRVTFTLKFRDGTERSYDGNGDLILPPEPELVITLEAGQPVIRVINTTNEVQIQSAPSLSGPWTDWPVKISNVQPAAVAPESNSKFFRVKKP